MQLVMQFPVQEKLKCMGMSLNALSSSCEKLQIIIVQPLKIVIFFLQTISHTRGVIRRVSPKYIYCTPGCLKGKFSVK